MLIQFIKLKSNRRLYPVTANLFQLLECEAYSIKSQLKKTFIRLTKDKTENDIGVKILDFYVKDKTTSFWDMVQQFHNSEANIFH